MLSVEQVINVLTVEQPMGSLWGNQCAHCGVINVLTVEQPICSLWSNQCAHCGAINMHQDLSSIHATVRQPKQSISNQFDVVHALSLHAANRNQMCTFSDLIVRSAVKGTTVPSVMKMGQRRFHVIFRLRCGLLEGHGKV